MSPRKESTHNMSGGEQVIELSFSVAEMIKAIGRLEQSQAKAEERNDQAHQDTRGDIRSLRQEVRDDFVTKPELASVKKTADDTSSSINKIALGVIASLITAIIGFFFFFAQRGIGG